MMNARVAVAILVLTCVPASARAQSEGWLALGVGYTHTSPKDPSAATSHDAVGIAWRFGHPRTGFGWAFGFNWFEHRRRASDWRHRNGAGRDARAAVHARLRLHGT